MTDPSPAPEPRDDPNMEPEREMVTSTPRWVKMFGIVALALVLLFVLLQLIGGGGTAPIVTGA